MSSGTIHFGDCRYKVLDLQAAKKFYSHSFKIKTYFDEPTWVVFLIHDYQLWLEPQNFTGESVYESSTPFYKPLQQTGLTFWAVEDVVGTCNRFKEMGGNLFKAPKRDGPYTYAVVEDPWGNKLGLHSNLF